MEEISLFSFRAGNSPIHRLPPWLKILLVPAVNIALFSLSPWVSLSCVAAFAAIFFLLGFSISEQLADLKPVLFYGAFLYVVHFFIHFSTFADFDVSLGLRAYALRMADGARISALNALGDKGTAFFCVRFCACVQSCALMFRTSTSIEIKEGVEAIERTVRRFLPCRKEPRFAFAVSMLLNFIPVVFKLWSRLLNAWKARGGKTSVRMFATLVPVLFSVGLKHSLDTTKAVLNRRNSDSDVSC